MKQNYDFLAEGEGKPVAVPLAECFTNGILRL
jgi:hypothetical protein